MGSRLGRSAFGWLFSVRPGQVVADLIAGLQGAISSFPGGMATAVLVGVHPIQGLYACLAGPIAGGLAARTRLMIITTTGAVALAAGSALHNVSASQRPAAVGLLTLFVAAALIVAGVLRLGRYTRFVAHSVMTGFLTGISVNIICGQLAGLTGTKTHGHVAIEDAAQVLLHPGRISLASTALRWLWPARTASRGSTIPGRFRQAFLRLPCQIFTSCPTA
jgi:sulfate permease, SulP family